MDGIEYSFGIGDGEVNTWETPADLDLSGDGVLDAVALDFDGDGLVDDAMWDSDGDGVANIVVIDAEVIDAAAVDSGAGGFTQWYTDPVGDGTWSGYRNGAVESLPTPVPPDPVPSVAAAPMVVADPEPAVLVDTNADGILDRRLSDADGDGLLDTVTDASVRLPAGG